MWKKPKDMYFNMSFFKLRIRFSFIASLIFFSHLEGVPSTSFIPPRLLSPPSPFCFFYMYYLSFLLMILCSFTPSPSSLYFHFLSCNSFLSLQLFFPPPFFTFILFSSWDVWYQKYTWDAVFHNVILHHALISTIYMFFQWHSCN